jgi:Ethanolamine utilization protein EutJ (predicted chaperonin)
MTKALDSSASAKKISIVPQEASRMSMNADELIDMKLHAAQEILAEVFGISVVEAEEMIRQRSREKMLWPASYPVDDR